MALAVGEGVTEDEEGRRAKARASDTPTYTRPIEKATIQSVGKEADVDFLDEDVTATFPPSMLRILVQLDTAAKCHVMVDNGSSEVTLVLNSGVDLAAGCLYLFDVLVADEDSVNFQADGAVTVDRLIVQEVPVVV